MRWNTIDRLEGRIAELEAERDKWRDEAERSKWPKDAAQRHHQRRAEVERLRGLVKRAALIFDEHIDYPQAVSHAELRATAREFREALGEKP